MRRLLRCDAHRVPDEVARALPQRERYEIRDPGAPGSVRWALGPGSARAQERSLGRDTRAARAGTVRAQALGQLSSHGTTVLWSCPAVPGVWAPGQRDSSLRLHLGVGDHLAPFRLVGLDIGRQLLRRS